jgi:hypothetical protein
VALPCWAASIEGTPAAKLGPFEGRVAGIGGEVAYNFMLGKSPATLRLHGTTEFAAQNRAQGHSGVARSLLPALA